MLRGGEVAAPRRVVLQLTAAHAANHSFRLVLMDLRSLLRDLMRFRNFGVIHEVVRFPGLTFLTCLCAALVMASENAFARCFSLL